MLTKSGGNTFTWRSNNNLAITPFAGTLNITGGTFEIQDGSGRLDTASAINIRDGGTLLLDNQPATNNQNQNNRLSNTAPITMDRGIFTFTASNNVQSNETVGEFIFNSGYNIITLDADYGSSTASSTSQGDARLNAQALTRANRATGLIRGDNLGFALNGLADTTAAAVTTGGQTGDPGGSESNLRLTTAPTLSHPDTSGTGRGVIPWLTGGGTAGNGGNTLVTYNGTEGTRLLDITPTTTDYSFQEFAVAGTLASTAIADQNVYVDFTANVDATLDANTTVRALVIDNTANAGADVFLGGNTLTVASGIVLSTGTQNNELNLGQLTFGPNASTGYEGRIHGVRRIDVRADIIDNGGNTVDLTTDGTVLLYSTGNSYGGTTFINSGALQLGAAGVLPDTTAVTVNANNAVLRLDRYNETIAGIEGNGIVDNYNNTVGNDAVLTLTSADDYLFEGLVRDGRAATLALVKSGTGTQTLSGETPSTYTGGTTVAEGTLALDGGVTDRIAPTGTVTFGDALNNTSGVLQIGGASGALDQTLAGVDSVGTGTTSAIVGGASAISTLTVNQATTGTLAGSLGGTGTNEDQLAIVKNGAGDLIVTGNADYTGATTVNEGRLVIQGANSDLDGPIVVNAGELRVAGDGLLGSGSASTITVADGGSLIFADGDTNQTFSGTGVILDLTQTSGTTQLGFGLDGATNDRITLGASQSLSLTGLIDTVIVVNNAPTLTQYLLIDSAADGAFGGTGSFQIGAIENAGNFIYDIARESTGTDPDQLYLTVTPNTTPPPDDAWWKGDLTGPAAGSWGAVQLGGDSNWDTSQSGGVDAAVPPGSNSHVHFSADGAANYATQLLQDLTIKALTFHTGSGTNGVSVSGTGTLTIGNGTDTPSLTVESGGNDAISILNPVALGASQSWNIEDATSVLTLGGGLSGTGDLALNDNGTAAGTLLLNGAPSTLVGTVTVSGGTVAFEDAGSLSADASVVLESGTVMRAGGATEATGVVIGGLSSTGGAGSLVGGNANNSTVIFSPTGTFTYTGTVGGAGTNENNLNLVMDGPGTQVLDGAVSHAGSTLVQEGTLQLGPSASFTGSGTLSVIAEDNATAIFDVNGASISPGGTVTLGGLGTNATPQIIDTAGTGLLTLQGNVLYDATNDPLGGLIGVNLALGGASRTFTVNDSASAAEDLLFTGSITESGNFALNLAGDGTGRITGEVTLAATGTSSDINVNSTGTWIIENNVSFGDDFNANDGTVIVQGAGKIGAVTGDDLILGADNDGIPAIVELNTANAFVGDDLYVRSGSILKIGADNALTEALDNTGMNDLVVADTGIVTPGGSIVDLQGYSIGVENIVLGGRLNTEPMEFVEGHIINTGGSRTNTLTTSANSTLRLGTVEANLAGTGGIIKDYHTTVTLSGNNSFTGNTELRGGELILDFGPSTTDTESRLASAGTLTFGGTNWRDAAPRLIVEGDDAFDMTQTVASTSFQRGAATIDVNSNGGSMTLELGDITQANGSTARFDLPASGAITTTNADTAFLGGWAVVNGQSFAQVSGGQILEGAPTTANDLTTWTAGADIVNDAAYSGTLTCPVPINSLTFDAAAASTIASSEPVPLEIASGGILVTPDVGANASVIDTDLTTAGGAFYLHQHNENGDLTIQGDLLGSSTVSKSGLGTVVLSGTNETGSVYVQEGTLSVTGGQAISDNSFVYVMGEPSAVFEVMDGQTETIGRLDGGLNSQGTVRVGTSSTLTVNNTSSTTFGGVFDGAGVFVKNGSGNLNLNGVTETFTGVFQIDQGLLQLSSTGRINSAAGIVINKNGTLLLDNNGTTRSGARIDNNAFITLNSASGTFSGSTVPRGLAIRTDQNAATNEDVGVINIASGASYVTLEATSTGTSAQSQILADDFIRTPGATLDVRGHYLGSNSGRRTQFRINNTTNQTNFINTQLVGAGGALGSTTLSIVPWAIGENLTGNLGAANMGNSLVTYVSGRGFIALDLATEYTTLASATGPTDNVRESLTADLTGLTSQTVNALVIHNDNTAASAIQVTGSGAGQSLANTSGAFLFTLNSGATASSAHTVTLGGFDDGISTTSSEYVFHVVNPTAAASPPTLAVTLTSPLTSAAHIVKSGRGDLILTAPSTAGGGSNGTFINEGLLEIGALDQIGGTTGGIQLAGGTLRLGTGFADDIGGRALDIAPGGGVLDTNGNDVTATGIAITGSGDWTKTGLGTLTLTGTATDSSTGTLTLQQGVLALGDTAGSNAFGSGDIEIRPIAFGGSTVTLLNTASDQIDDAAVIRLFNVGGSGGAPSGGRWDLNGFSETVGGIEMTSGSGSSTIVTVGAGGTLTVLGDIVLNNNRGGAGTTPEQVEITGGGILDLGGDARVIEVNSSVVNTGNDAGIETIIQNGGIVKTGSQILYLENAGNTYAGGTVINEGTVSIATDTNLGADTAGNGIEIRNGATLQSTGSPLVTLSDNRTVLLGAGGGNIEVLGAATDALVVDGVVSGDDCGPLTKLGDGALALTAANTYAGGTDVTAGALVAANTNGSATGLGSVLVQTGATLTGDGFIAPAADENVVIQGTLMVGDPTASTGTDLSIITSGTGALTFETGSFTTLNLWSGDGLGDNTGTLTAADLLIVGGNVNLGGTLQVLNPNGMTGWNEGDVWKLFDWSGLTTPLVAGNEFEALDLPDISGSGYAWDLTDLYIGGTITVAPEPSRLMLLAFGLLVLTGRRRRI